MVKCFTITVKIYTTMEKQDKLYKTYCIAYLEGRIDFVSFIVKISKLYNKEIDRIIANRGNSDDIINSN